MIPNNIAFYLQKNGYIEEKELPIYVYGLSAFLNSSLQLAVIFLLGLLSNYVTETIAFITVFVTTRRFLGGFHANSKAKCMMLDICIWALTTHSYIIFWHMRFSWLVLIEFFISLIVTYRYAPVENNRKPLNSTQKRTNRKKGFILICFFTVVSVVYFNVSENVSYTIVATILCVSIFILAERWKYAKRKNE